MPLFFPQEVVMPEIKPGFIEIPNGLSPVRLARHELQIEASVQAQVSVIKDTITVTPLKPLQDNKRYVLVVTGDVRSAGGAAPEDWVVLTFTSRYTPLYCTAREVWQEVGPVAESLSYDDVYAEIQNLSLQVDNFYQPPGFDPANPSYAVRQFVRFQAAYNLVDRVHMDLARQAGQSRTVDAIQVQYTKVATLEELAGRLYREAQRWQQAMLGYNDRGHAAPRYVVKGENINPSPITSRSF